MLFVTFALSSLFYTASASVIGKNVSFRPDYTLVSESLGWFKFHEIPATWNDARHRCELEGAMLASPLNEVMRAELTKFIKSIQTTQNTTKNKKSAMFTGISAAFSKGYYYSIEGVSLSDIPHFWALSEPDNKEDSENCIAMYEDGTLADVKCNATFKYACYRKYDELITLNECGTIDNGYQLKSATGKCYKFHSTPRNWLDAFGVCAAEGGHLAIINSDIEAEVLKEILAQHPASEFKKIEEYFKNFALIGFQSWFGKGQWVTLNGQTLKEAGYGAWAAGEPNNYKGGYYKDGEFCGLMSRNAFLFDVNCRVETVSICEKEPAKY